MGSGEGWVRIVHGDKRTYPPTDTVVFLASRARRKKDLQLPIYTGKLVEKNDDSYWLIYEGLTRAFKVREDSIIAWMLIKKVPDFLT